MENSQTVLGINNLSCRYRKGGPTVLNELTLELEPGAMTAVIGPNGCGKSTLLKAIMGFLDTPPGAVTLRGKPLSAFSRRDLARHIAYLPQESYCPDYLTVGELVQLGGYARQPLFGHHASGDDHRFEAALAQVDLRAKAHEPVNRLSGGQRQRAWIAMILAQDAETVLLDEPVNHLDVKYQYAVMQLARDTLLAHGKTVIAVVHDLNLASQFADQVVMLKDGQRVASGPTREVITAENIKSAFDFDAVIVEQGGRVFCLPSAA
ncbi:MAG: ABC transporter ATP-binding protein [Pseudomonadota bacterium]